MDGWMDGWIVASAPASASASKSHHTTANECVNVLVVSCFLMDKNDYRMSRVVRPVRRPHSAFTGRQNILDCIQVMEQRLSSILDFDRSIIRDLRVAME